MYRQLALVSFTFSLLATATSSYIIARQDETPPDSDSSLSPECQSTCDLAFQPGSICGDAENCLCLPEVSNLRRQCFQCMVEAGVVEQDLMDTELQRWEQECSDGGDNGLPSQCRESCDAAASSDNCESGVQSCICQADNRNSLTECVECQVSAGVLSQAEATTLLDEVEQICSAPSTDPPTTNPPGTNPPGTNPPGSDPPKNNPPGGNSGGGTGSGGSGGGSGSSTTTTTPASNTTGASDTASAAGKLSRAGSWTVIAGLLVGGLLI